MTLAEASLVFALEGYGPLARDLCALAGCAEGRLERRLFPDGERYLRVLDDVAERDVALVGGTASDAATLDLYDLACGLVTGGARRLTMVVPWFGYATMERAVKPGEVVTAKTRARLFSSIPASPAGNRLLLLDVHAEGIPYYFEGATRAVHVYGKPVVLPAVAEAAGGGSFVLASTDAGRAKWVESLANELGVPAAFVFKRRHDDGRTEVAAVRAHVEGRPVVIYDDMIRTGGSLVGAARAYREAGATRLAAVATHGLFPGDSLARLRDTGLFERIVVTDSHPRARELEGPDLTVRSVAPLFLPYLRSPTRQASGAPAPSPKPARETA